MSDQRHRPLNREIASIERVRAAEGARAAFR
jgi:hypothetical protein